VTKRNTFARLSLLFLLKALVIRKSIKAVKKAAAPAQFVQMFRAAKQRKHEWQV